jgi:hypothetical protein
MKSRTIGEDAHAENTAPPWLRTEESGKEVNVKLRALATQKALNLGDNSISSRISQSVPQSALDRAFGGRVFFVLCVGDVVPQSRPPNVALKFFYRVFKNTTIY